MERFWSVSLSLFLVFLVRLLGFFFLVFVYGGFWVLHYLFLFFVSFHLSPLSALLYKAVC